MLARLRKKARSRRERVHGAARFRMHSFACRRQPPARADCASSQGMSGTGTLAQVAARFQVSLRDSRQAGRAGPAGIPAQAVAPDGE